MMTGIYSHKKTGETIQVYLGNDGFSSKTYRGSHPLSEFYMAYTQKYSCDCNCRACTYEGIILSGKDITDIKKNYKWIGNL